MIGRACLGLAMMAAAAGSAIADETKLAFATVTPPGSVVNTQIILPWAKRINDEGKGVVAIDVREGPTLANFGNVYERVLSDVVQIGWGIQAAIGGKFPLSNVNALPLVFERSVDGSIAFWRVYKAGLLNSEYDQVVPLMLVALPTSGLHFARPLKSLESLDGAKLIVPGKIQGEAITNLGGTPNSLPLTDMYEALQRHTVDGTMIAWVAFNPWKLAEVTFYHVDTSLGGAAGMVFMSKAKYDALPPAARKIIDANSGEDWSRRFGTALDAEGDAQRAAVKASDKQTVVELTPAQRASWEKKVTPSIAQWTKDVPGAEPVLARYRAEAAKHGS
ncbi:MAG TPA: TRAP transporter substrate-binding protein [Stellaceae bacterium]|nr:TRAP transporter substrate-binding protein [Stellaceae bacterium]